MVSAAFAIVSCRLTSMGCTPDAIVPPLQRRFRPLPLSVDPSSTGHLVCLMSPPSHGRLRTSIPAGARDLWSKCLIHARASVVAHRDERSWVDLLTMPVLTLGGPSRGGRPRQAITVSRRCQDSSGSRLANPPLIANRIRGSDFRLPSHVPNREASLIHDGALRRACTALTQEPPVQPTPSVIDELRGSPPALPPSRLCSPLMSQSHRPCCCPLRISRHDPESRV